MARWKSRYINKKFGPLLAEFEIINEDSDGYPYTECSYILLSDIPERYYFKFKKWMDDNKFEIIVERKTRIENGEVEYLEKKSVNPIYWEKWYSVYK